VLRAVRYTHPSRLSQSVLPPFVLGGAPSFSRPERGASDVLTRLRKEKCLRVGNGRVSEFNQVLPCIVGVELSKGRLARPVGGASVAPQFHLPPRGFPGQKVRICAYWHWVGCVEPFDEPILVTGPKL